MPMGRGGKERHERQRLNSADCVIRILTQSRLTLDKQRLRQNCSSHAHCHSVLLHQHSLKCSGHEFETIVFRLSSWLTLDKQRFRRNCSSHAHCHSVLLHQHSLGCNGHQFETILQSWIDLRPIHIETIRNSKIRLNLFSLQEL